MVRPKPDQPDHWLRPWMNIYADDAELHLGESDLLSVASGQHGFQCDLDAGCMAIDFMYPSKL